jgi:FAD/FMN-containing dehydrogenase
MPSISADTAIRPVPELEERLSGDVVRPGDKRYDAARALWNAMIDHRPALIARPRTAAEVATAIVNARDAGVEVAVRCGGHSISGASMSDGGMTIDLSAMRGVSVDPVARTARVGGGALVIDVGEVAAPHALAMPYGQVSHTGVGGFTLGGGVSWISRKYGLSLDNVLSAEVVTADGEIVRASAEENPDLFWAIRGGGGNFGVVTEFELGLNPHGPQVLGGMILHRLEDAGEAMRFSRDFMDQAPRELTVLETFITVPPADPFPAELRGKPALALGVVYAGSAEEGAAAVQPLREFGDPALDLVGPMRQLEVQKMLDDTAPHGMRNYNKSHFLRELPDAAIDAQVEHHAGVPSAMSLVINARMGGAIDDVPAGDTAFGHRGSYRLVWVVSAWWEGDDAEQIDWCRRGFEAMAPYSTGGVYVNALGAEGEERVRAGYANEIWTRLVAAKDRWDPDNVFHLNQNIAPSNGANA